jgi:putative oxygen-independent coproporphyrinogen III oxidase
MHCWPISTHEANAGCPAARLGSIFFGGGTPSLMPPGTVSDLIAAATRHWTPAADLEITLEANPSSVEAARFADLARAGVNRLSLGMQAFDDAALRFLGRAHDAREGLAALDVAMARFARVSFDLIYARPNQSMADWEAELARALSFGTGHLSLYQLTIEPGTRFETLVRTGELIPADADHAATLFELTQAMTDAAGIPAYEVSNHARRGEESRHNLTYWRYGDYAGIGPGAHGRRQGLATVRHRKPENWLAAVARRGDGLQSEDALSPAEQAREALLMGLRLAEGIVPDALAARFGLPVEALLNARQVRLLTTAGLMEGRNARLRVTPQGMLLLDSILAAIVEV